MAALTEEQIINHLLFHKSIVSDDEDVDRINHFLDMAKERGEGKHIGIPDPFDRAIALAFDLVLEHDLDPWRINLMEFASLYLKRVQEREDLDLISAGRLLLMAWTILRKQSEDLKIRAEPPPPPEEEFENPWDSIPTDMWLHEDPDELYTETVIASASPPIDEKIRHQGDRKVTFMELLEALDEARKEAELREEINRRRAEERAVRRKMKGPDPDSASHKEDQEQEIAEVWGRIARLNGHPIPITEIQEKNRDDLVKTLVSILFLARSQRIHLWQEDFPYGMIYIQNKEKMDPAQTTEEQLQASQN